MTPRVEDGMVRLRDVARNEGATGVKDLENLEKQVKPSSVPDGTDDSERGGRERRRLVSISCLTLA